MFAKNGYLKISLIFFAFLHELGFACLAGDRKPVQKIIGGVYLHYATGAVPHDDVVKALLTKLGSPEYPEREEAKTKLLELGNGLLHSEAFLQDGLQSKVLEVSNRSQLVYSKLSAPYRLMDETSIRLSALDLLRQRLKPFSEFAKMYKREERWLNAFAENAKDSLNNLAELDLKNEEQKKLAFDANLNEHERVKYAEEYKKQFDIVAVEKKNVLLRLRDHLAENAITESAELSDEKLNWKLSDGSAHVFYFGPGATLYGDMTANPFYISVEPKDLLPARSKLPNELHLMRIADHVKLLEVKVFVRFSIGADEVHKSYICSYQYKGQGVAGGTSNETSVGDFLDLIDTFFSHQLKPAE